jgi:hypothetical protein
MTDEEWETYVRDVKDELYTKYRAHPDFAGVSASKRDGEWRILVRTKTGALRDYNLTLGVPIDYETVGDVTAL